MGSLVKEEIDAHQAAAAEEPAPRRRRSRPSGAAVFPMDSDAVIDLTSSESEAEDGGGRKQTGASGAGTGGDAKRRRVIYENVLPLGFLDPLPQVEEGPPGCIAMAETSTSGADRGDGGGLRRHRQFWKAGDYDGALVSDHVLDASGMDHVRVHPKFLHSNATSHKWALGALAELLDNSLDEACNGGCYIKMDMLRNRKDKRRMLLVEDNGGGMNPEKMRHCMSLGYSMKSKLVNTIGQYGNGFKTSTMRLGADVIVFSRSCGKEGRSPTQSIGMLSYTFLRDTGKEDIVVPMLDYEKKDNVWSKMTLSSSTDLKMNLETIIRWSPYSSESDLLEQFSSMAEQGTRVVIYNLWENDHGELELDFDADPHDIQLGGVNRDQQKIDMAGKFPNSKHFLTYRHSLRSYASILYRHLPHGFRMILRGKDIAHHNIVNDMMMKHEVTYKPQSATEGISKDTDVMVAVVKMGFVKDAKNHIDVQGFNVYHKNRLIKPFWRVWNPAGSDGRGVIGVLEANFIEPAHDKQDFERTIVLSRLEARLIQLQKTYWSSNCHKIGYAPRCNRKFVEGEKEGSPNRSSELPLKSRDSNKSGSNVKFSANSSNKAGNIATSPIGPSNLRFHNEGNPVPVNGVRNGRISESRCPPRSGHHKPTEYSSDESDSGLEYIPRRYHGKSSKVAGDDGVQTRLNTKMNASCDGSIGSHEESDVSVTELKDENKKLKARLKHMEDTVLPELRTEKEKNSSLSEQLEATKKKLEETNCEQEALIDVFSEERVRRDKEEENLRKKIKDASLTIQELLQKLNAQNKSSDQFGSKCLVPANSTIQ